MTNIIRCAHPGCKMLIHDVLRYCCKHWTDPILSPRPDPIAQCLNPCGCGTGVVRLVDSFNGVWTCTSCGEEYRLQDLDGLDPVDLLNMGY